MLLVAVEDIDKKFTKLLGDNFGFQNMQWVAHGTPPGYDGELVKSLDGAPVGLARLAQGPARSGVHPPRRARARHRAHPHRDADLPAHPVGQPAGEAAGRKRGARHARGAHRSAHRPAEPGRSARGLCTDARPGKVKGGIAGRSLCQHRPVQRHQRRFRARRRRRGSEGHGQAAAAAASTGRYIGAPARRQLHHAGPRA